MSNFGYYNVIYGLLSSVIVLLLSAYLVSFTFLLGGELNGNTVQNAPRRMTAQVLGRKAFQRMEELS